MANLGLKIEGLRLRAIQVFLRTAIWIVCLKPIRFLLRGRRR